MGGIKAWDLQSVIIKLEGTIVFRQKTHNRKNSSYYVTMIVTMLL